jgi:hypothetical protein
MGDLVSYPLNAVEQFLQKRLWRFDRVANRTRQLWLAHRRAPCSKRLSERSPSSRGGADVMVGEDLGDDSGDAPPGRNVQEFVGTVRI